MKNQYRITTQSRVIDDPHSLQPDPQEAMHSLPKINRWNGHTSKPWSVGAHSLHMFYVAAVHHPIIANDKQLLLKIFVHDFAEAYIGDIIKPIKNMTDLEDIENEIIDRLYEVLKLTPATHGEHAIIKQLDINCVCTEHAQFFPTHQPCPIEGNVFPESLHKMADAHYKKVQTFMEYVFTSLTDPDMSVKGVINHLRPYFPVRR